MRMTPEQSPGHKTPGKTSRGQDLGGAFHKPQVQVGGARPQAVNTFVIVRANPGFKPNHDM